MLLFSGIQWCSGIYWFSWFNWFPGLYWFGRSSIHYFSWLNQGKWGNFFEKEKKQIICITPWSARSGTGKNIARDTLERSCKSIFAEDPDDDNDGVLDEDEDDDEHDEM